MPYKLVIEAVENRMQYYRLQQHIAFVKKSVNLL